MPEHLTAEWKKNLDPEEVTRRERFGTAYNRLRALNIGLAKTQTAAAQLKAAEKKKPWRERDRVMMTGKRQRTRDEITCALNLMLKMRGKLLTRIKYTRCRTCGQSTAANTSVAIHAAPANSQHITDQMIQNFKLREFLR
jgi:hypothetical protein